ncbi:MAG: hypothetical protein WAV28_06685 [Sedimentisphaerales bacterium]
MLERSVSPSMTGYVFSQATESAVSLCGTGFPAATSVARRAARENTAKIGRATNKTNEAKHIHDGLDAQNVIARPKGPWQSQFIVFEIASSLAPKGQAPRNDKEGC